MHLVGQLVNPSAPLMAVFETLSDGLLPPTERLQPQLETGRLGNGVVQRAVVKVLAAAQRPMRVLEVHGAVEGLLGHPVSKDSVSWCLAAGVRGMAPRFERVARGRYVLA